MITDEATLDYLNKYNHYLWELSIGFNKQRLDKDYDGFLLFKIVDEIMKDDNIQQGCKERKTFNNPKDALSYLQNEAKEGEEIVLDEIATIEHPREIRFFKKNIQQGCGQIYCPSCKSYECENGFVCGAKIFNEIFLCPSCQEKAKGGKCKYDYTNI
jgi:hypothetical protein